MMLRDWPFQIKEEKLCGALCPDGGVMGRGGGKRNEGLL